MDPVEGTGGGAGASCILGAGGRTEVTFSSLPVRSRLRLDGVMMGSEGCDGVAGKPGGDDIGPFIGYGGWSKTSSGIWTAGGTGP